MLALHDYGLGGARRCVTILGASLAAVFAIWPGVGHASTIVAGHGAGTPPQVGVYDGGTGAQLSSFFAYDAAFAGGVRVAAADVNGDGVADVVTGAGPGGAPHVKVFDGVSGALIRSFFAFSPSFTGGVYVAASALNAGNGVAGQLDSLLAAVEGVGPGAALSNKVRLAQAHLAAGDIAATCSDLDGFIALVKAQSGKKITDAEASSLIAFAEQIKAALGC